MRITRLLKGSSTKNPSTSVHTGLAFSCAFALAMQLLSVSNPLHAADAAEGGKAKVTDKMVLKAQELEPNLENGKALYFNCALCHTPEGWGSPGGRYPQIAGQHKSVILKQLADIRAGNRDNPTMFPFAMRAFSHGEQGLSDLASYITQLPMVPNNSVGPGMELAHGEKLYKDNCVKCHGDNGEGDAAEYYPRIQGQHFQYLLREMRWIKNGKRRNADEKMVKQIHGFSDRDLVSIADYTSRLQPDKSLLADHMDWRNPDFRSGFRTAPKAQSEMK